MKPPTLPLIGLPADDLLKMRGRSAEHATKAPTRIGYDRQGMVVLWHYPDCDVRLHYRKGCYRIAAIEPKEAAE